MKEENDSCKSGVLQHRPSTKFFTVWAFEINQGPKASVANFSKDIADARGEITVFNKC